MTKMVVAVTGGIGSGKTAVSDRFASRGVTVADMDIASRAIVEPGQPALEQIAEHFGTEVIDASGCLDRRALREKIFDNDEERSWLERLTHPLVNEWTYSRLQNANSAYAIVVNPLLRGKGGYVDRVLVVDVPVEVQIERTMLRDSVSHTHAQSIVSAQIDRDSRLAFADDIIVNAGALDDLEPKIDALHAKYLDLADGT